MSDQDPRVEFPIDSIVWTNNSCEPWYTFAEDFKAKACAATVRGHGYDTVRASCTLYVRPRAHDDVAPLLYRLIRTELWQYVHHTRSKLYREARFANRLWKAWHSAEGHRPSDTKMRYSIALFAAVARMRRKGAFYDGHRT